MTFSQYVPPLFSKTMMVKYMIEKLLEMKNFNPKYIVVSALLLITLLGFFQQLNAQLYHIGDIYTFPDGSKGVVCYINPENRLTGWAVALNDLPLQYGIYEGTTLNTTGIESISSGAYNTFSTTEWVSNGYLNTQLLRATQQSPAANAVDFYNGWYIPDIMQLRIVQSLIPVIRTSVEAAGGSFSNMNSNTTQRYWSSSRDGNNMLFLNVPDGTRGIGTVDHTKQNNTRTPFFVRPVRDFGTEVVAYWQKKYDEDSVKTASMKVAPTETQDYDAVVEFNKYSLSLTGTVKVNETYNRDTIHDVVCESNANPYTLTLHDNFTNSDVDFTYNLSAKATPYVISETLHTTRGCDSIVTLKLWVIGSCDFILRDTICPLKEGETYRYRHIFDDGTLFVGGLEYDTTFAFGTEPGVYEYHAVKTSAIDQTSQLQITAYYNLNFHDTYLFESTDETCSNAGTYEWSGRKTVSVPQNGGEYVFWDSLKTKNGCDSVYKLTLNVKQSYVTELNISACDSYEWDGITRTASGDFEKMYTTVDGCDSLVRLHLTINTSPQVTLADTTVCHNVGEAQMTAVAIAGSGTELHYSWSGHAIFDPATVHSQKATVRFPTDVASCAAEYAVNVTVTDENNCSATHQAHLRVESTIPVITTHLPHDSLSPFCGAPASLPSVADFTVIDNCYPNAEVTLKEESETAVGCYRSVSFVASYGNECHSAEDVVVTFFWKMPDQTDLYAVECEEYEWFGNTYTESGTYTHTLTNSCGCDSILTLHLTVIRPAHKSTTVTSCDHYVWNGTDYTQSGDYTFARTLANGCVQVDTLHLTIGTDTYGDTVAEACGSFVWYGHEFFETPDVEPIHILYNANQYGCDSIVRLHLTIFEPKVVRLSDTILAENLPYEWDGHIFTRPGNIYDTLTSAHGCDSVRVYVLVTRDCPVVVSTVVSPEICKNDAAITIHAMNADQFSIDGGVTFSSDTIYRNLRGRPNPYPVVAYSSSDNCFKVAVTFITPLQLPTISCPPDIDETLGFGDCALIADEENIGSPYIIGSLSRPFDITSDIPADLLLGVGEHTITWKIEDSLCGAIDSCKQKVVVSYPQCPDAVDCEGNVYHGVRIGCDCWTERNLESNCYGDANECVTYNVCVKPIPCVYEYESMLHPDADANVAIYGKLYCAEAALGDSADNGRGHIRGICPEGWYLPTPEKYAALNQYGNDALKSPLYWTDGGGSNTTGFSWLPAGWYNGALQRFEGMLSEGYFWSTEIVDGEVRTTAFEVRHDCDNVLRVETHTGLGYSVRCIKEKE